mmetsp:Transcript_20807/g.34022  ORF Transcript_20807/g.34022 Transcript_20807/m.34022 type:complete len:109 (+) Transcript_20807:3-329(+)
MIRWKSVAVTGSPTLKRNAVTRQAWVDVLLLGKLSTSLTGEITSVLFEAVIHLELTRKNMPTAVYHHVVADFSIGQGATALSHCLDAGIGLFYLDNVQIGLQNLAVVP